MLVRNAHIMGINTNPRKLTNDEKKQSSYNSFSTEIGGVTPNVPGSTLNPFANDHKNVIITFGVVSKEREKRPHKTVAEVSYLQFFHSPKQQLIFHHCRRSSQLAQHLLCKKEGINIFGEMHFYRRGVILRLGSLMAML